MNKNNNHLYLDFEKFKEIYYSNNNEKMDMKTKLMQKFFITFLLSDNKITSYTNGVTEFKKKFETIKFIITEDNFKNIKNSLSGNY